MNSSELKGYLTGLIFGDGHIDKGVTNRAFSIKTINQDFAEKIKKDLNSCSPFDVKIVYHPECYRNGCNHKENWEVRIKAHPYFAKKYHHFYDDYRHRIASKESLSWLNAQGLANWYMSDGYICLVGKQKEEIRSRRIDICTDRYSKETIMSMIDMLKNRFNLDCSLIKRNERYRIRIKSTSYQDFINLIYPYMVPSMLYKLYLAYPKKPKCLDEEGWKLQEYLRSAITLTSNVEG